MPPLSPWWSWFNLKQVEDKHSIDPCPTTSCSSSHTLTTIFSLRWSPLWQLYASMNVCWGVSGPYDTIPQKNGTFQMSVSFHNNCISCSEEKNQSWFLCPVSHMTVMSWHLGYLLLKPKVTDVRIIRPSTTLTGDWSSEGSSCGPLRSRTKGIFWSGGHTQADFFQYLILSTVPQVRKLVEITWQSCWPFLFLLLPHLSHPPKSLHPKTVNLDKMSDTWECLLAGGSWPVAQANLLQNQKAFQEPLCLCPISLEALKPTMWQVWIPEPQKSSAHAVLRVQDLQVDHEPRFQVIKHCNKMIQNFSGWPSWCLVLFLLTAL